METEAQEQPSTQEEQLTQTSDKTKTQNTMDLEEHSQTKSAEQSCPISQIPAIRDDPPQKPTVIIFRDRPNDMSLQERLHMTEKKTLYGYSQAADWCNPQLRRIIRCPCCEKIVNTNGIEKAIRTHLRQAHQSLMHNPILVQVQKAGGKKQEFAIPAGLCTRQQKKPAVQTGKQRPKMLPAPLPLEKLCHSEEGGYAEGDREVLEFDGNDPINDSQQKRTSQTGMTDGADPKHMQLPITQPMGSTQRPPTPTVNEPKNRGRAKMRPGLDDNMDEDSDAFESDEERPPNQGGFGDSTIFLSF